LDKRQAFFMSANRRACLALREEIMPKGVALHKKNTLEENFMGQTLRSGVPTLSP
jgi:hypothetical protein